MDAQEAAEVPPWILFRQREAEAARDAWLRGYELDPGEPLLWEVVERFEFAVPLAPTPTRPPGVERGVGDD